MKVSLVDSDSQDWVDFLAHVDYDVYQTPGYCRLDRLMDNSEAKCLIVNEGLFSMLFPIMISQISDLKWDAKSPYGFPGILFTGSPNSTEKAKLLEKGLAFLSDSGCVSVFLRSRRDCIEDSIKSLNQVQFERESDIVICDLEVNNQAKPNVMSPDTLRRLRLSRAAGFTTISSSDLNDFKMFRKLYQARMIEVGAKARYLFSDEYFSNMVLEFGEQAKIRFVWKENEMIAAGIFLEANNHSTYHLSASTLEARKWGLPSLIIDDELRNLRDRGFTSLLLGGGKGGLNDSLLHFKRNFSDITLKFDVLGFVLLREDYLSLCKQSGVEKLNDFFPAYRSRV